MTVREALAEALDVLLFVVVTRLHSYWCAVRDAVLLRLRTVVAAHG